VLLLRYKNQGDTKIMFLLILGIFLTVLISATTVTAQGRPTPTPAITDETPDITGFYTDDSGLENDWESAVKELQMLGLIEGSGELLFTSEMAIESLDEEGGAESTYVNYVMGALISVRTSADGMPGVCTFITRGVMSRRGQIEQAVGIAITSEDEIIALELTPNQTSSRRLMVEYPTRGNATFYEPQYVLVLVNADRLTIWVNGEVYIDAWVLENALPADETYENEVTTTVNPESGCVMTGLWGYGF
jgi:hypothetical protein